MALSACSARSASRSWPRCTNLICQTCAPFETITPTLVVSARSWCSKRISPLPTMNEIIVCTIRGCVRSLTRSAVRSIREQAASTRGVKSGKPKSVLDATNYSTESPKAAWPRFIWPNKPVPQIFKAARHQENPLPSCAQRRIRRHVSRRSGVAAQLNHPNIAQIYELGEDEGQYYIAMDLLMAGIFGNNKKPRRMGMRIPLNSAHALPRKPVPDWTMLTDLRTHRDGT